MFLTFALAIGLVSPPAAAAQEPDAAEAQVPAAGSDRCAERPPGTFSRTAADLYCIDLHPTARAPDASGVAELRWAPGPFGVTVTPDGRHVHRLAVRVEGLPDPAELGPYRVYVAWATTPVLEPVVRLGRVANGRNDLGRVDLDPFLLWVSAEADPETRERQGPLVLRGRSAGMRMEPHELLAETPEALVAPEGRQAPHAHGAPERREAPQGPGHAGDAGDTWPMPPMYPGLPVLPGMRALRPEVEPLRLAPGDPSALPEAGPARLVDLPDGGTLDLEAGFVRRRIAGRELVMLAFNGQHPGPLVRVPEDATIFVNFTNRTPFPTTVHWHGVRLENRFDGVPGVTQEPVGPGESFRYRVRFPDAGVYWYHPHHREDLQQELGLYGNLLVEPPPERDYGPAHRTEALMVDDLLLDEEGVAPFGKEAATHALMGRFGNLFLVNGEPRYRLEVGRDAVVRFHLTNASNTRTLNLSFLPGDGRAPPPMKVIGTDVGRFEREERVRSVVLGPAERYTVEVRFERPGAYRLMNRVRAIDHLRGAFFPEERELGRVTVGEEPARPDLAASFDSLRLHAEAAAEIDRYRPHFDRPPDLELDLTMEAGGVPGLVRRVMAYDWLYFPPVEWAGTMPMMNWATTARDVRWILRDPATGKENGEIDWRFRVGDVVKVRLRNRRDAFHAMQHPIHVHGQRFLVLARDGVRAENLAWKDTALLPVGSTTDILLELSNPGRWMVHCHIAEHLEAGMKLVLEVEGPAAPVGTRP